MASAGVRLALEARCAAERVWIPRSLSRQAAESVLAHLGGELDTYETSPIASSLVPPPHPLAIGRALNADETPR